MIDTSIGTLQNIQRIIHGTNDKITLLGCKDEFGKNKVYVRYSMLNEQDELLGYKLIELGSEDSRDLLFTRQTPFYDPYTGKRNTLPLSYFNNFVKGLCSIAKSDARIPETKLLPRIGAFNGKIYLCLYSKNHKVVEISPEGWRIIDEYTAPVLFVPNAAAAELPEPQKGGSLQLLRGLVNLDDHNFRLLVMWLLAVLNPLIECPILSIRGGYESGKTTLTYFLKALIDPYNSSNSSNLGLLTSFNNEGDLYEASSSQYIIGIDDASNFTNTKKLGDIYYKLTTGADAKKRKKHTNNGVFYITVRNPLILSDVDFASVFPKLRERCLFLKLKHPENQKSIYELKKEFEAKRPFILGALLDVIAAALGDTTYKLEQDIYFKMRGAVEFAMKAAGTNTLPFNREQLWVTLNAIANDDKEAKLMENIFARTVYNEIVSVLYSTKISSVYFSSSELCNDVLQRVQSYEKTPQAFKNVPSNAVEFGRRLSEAKDLLEANGLKIEFKHTSKGTQIIATKVSPQSEQSDEDIIAEKCLSFKEAHFKAYTNGMLGVFGNHSKTETPSSESAETALSPEVTPAADETEKITEV